MVSRFILLMPISAKCEIIISKIVLGNETNKLIEKKWYRKSYRDNNFLNIIDTSNCDVRNGIQFAFLQSCLYFIQTLLQ